ncbi:MAG: hypothetical protein E7571_00905 [Ruminococcaceae bacterium]|nr:hypothetical protein [Oscillospiraceae bacterium]
MKINFNSAKRLQTTKGWGTSACWWSQACTDSDTQDKIIDLLYGKDGLGLNIYRYNVGGGTDPKNCRVPDPWRRTESMMLFDKEKEEPSWDFSRDKTAVEVMKKAVATGNVDTLILFANSPHYSQTSTGQASGSLLTHTCNIPKSKYKAFADYFLTVTEYFISEGLPVTYISPINEPQWKWGGDVVWQEGCHYEPEEVAEVLHIFATEIKRRNIPVKLCIPESGELLQTTPKYLWAILADDEIMSVTDVIAYHSYHVDNSPESRYEFCDMIVKANPQYRFDMTEWCELPCRHHTKDFKGALITARIIGQDMIYCRAVSWTSWVAVNGICKGEDGLDYADSLLSASADFSEWNIAERYYGFAHFSKFIPVGSTALDVVLRPTSDNNTFNAFAFRTPDGESVLVAVNEGEGKTLELAGGFTDMKVIMSTPSEKLKTVYDGKFTGSLTSPANSIVTAILR